MLKRPGFFHFGTNHTRPIESLETALAERSKNELQGALIVLPEALNYPADYWKRAQIAEPDSTVMCHLERTAREFCVVFVVGLIMSDANLVPRSSAFLINGLDAPKLICRKRSDDRLERYEPYTGNGSIEMNPFQYEGCCIGALVCNDASSDRETSVVEWRQIVINEMDSCSYACKILCIPACDTTSERSPFLRDSQKKTLVLANSYPNRCGSFAMRDGAELKSENGSVNRICLVELETDQTA